MTETIENSKAGRWLALGCLAPLLGLTLIFVSLAVWRYIGTGGSDTPSFIKSAESNVKRELSGLKRKVAKKSKTMPKPDLDQTVTALFSIEKALDEAKSFEELTPFILQKEPALVAPDVAALKYRFFNIYKNLLSTNDEIEESRSIYEMTAGTLSDLAGVVGYDAVNCS